MDPVIIVNAKTYPESTGKGAIALAQSCDAVAAKGAHIGLALQSFDLRTPVHKTQLFAQHVDIGEPGKHTGFFLAKHAKKLGCVGTILNHSEHKLTHECLVNTVRECKKLKLITIICADNSEEAARVAELSPDFIAVEPPELIGGDISVSTAKPEVISESLAAVGKVPLLVGAGVKDGRDVRIAMELGAKGVLVASGVVLAENPQAVLQDFLAH